MGVFFFITLITFFHVIFLWYMYLSLNYWNGRYLIHASLRHHLTYFQLNSSNHCHHCPKHSMVNGQFCCLWLFPCLRYVHVCNSFHWMAWKQRLNYEFRHTWWITGSRRYQKKNIRPTKEFMKCTCRSQRSHLNPFIAQHYFKSHWSSKVVWGDECCTNIFLTELRLGI